MRRPGMLIVDVQRCIACKRCVIECAVAHSASQELAAAMHENAAPAPRVQVRQLGDYTAPYQCRHCDDPPCVDSCPTDSLSKDADGGRVLLRVETCTAQKKCTRRCPFLGIWMNRDQSKAVKCDLCIGRVERGDEPACATACPTGAITYKSFDELTEEERGWRSGRPGAALVRRTGIRYVVDPETCIGCTRCARACPAEAVHGERKQAHEIVQERCVTCGGCYLNCPVDAIRAVAPGDLAEAVAEMAAKAKAAAEARASETTVDAEPAADASAAQAPTREEAAAAEPPEADAPPAERPTEEAPVAEEAPTADAGPPEEAPGAPPPAGKQPGGVGQKKLRRIQRRHKRKAKKAKGKRTHT